MTLDQLQVIDVIVELGSFRAAAESLHRAQSAVSYAVKNLEEELGFELFSRAGYRPVLTPSGEAYLRQARILLQQASELNGFSKLLAGETEAELKLSISAGTAWSPLIKVLKKFTEKFPQTLLHVVSEMMSGLELLTLGKVDIAIFIGFPKNSDIEVLKISKLSLPQVIKANHPHVSDDKNISRAELSSIPQIVIPTSHSEGSSEQAGVLTGGHRWFVNDVSAKKQLVLAGLGWGGLPDHLISKELKSGKLIKIDPNSSIGENMDVYLGRRALANQGPAATALWNQIKCCYDQ
jgi:DNA-binding transcriptional LysR family regulator